MSKSLIFDMWALVHIYTKYEVSMSDTLSIGGMFSDYRNDQARPRKKHNLDDKPNESKIEMIN